MRAIIDYKEIKKIINSLKKFVSYETYRTAKRMIRMEFDKEGQTVKAIAVDGYKLQVKVAPLIAIDESFIAYIRPEIPNVKGASMTEIVADNKGASLTVDYITLYSNAPNGEFMNYQEVYNGLVKKPPVATIDFNPDLLADALKTLKNGKKEPITLEIRGKLEPMLIREKGEAYTLVLPMRVRSEKE